jgi:hypothetical protein
MARLRRGDTLQPSSDGIELPSGHRQGATIASTNAGSVVPYHRVRLGFEGFPAAASQVPSVNPDRLRIRVEGHRAKLIPGEHPQIELLAAGQVVGLCRFHERAPAPLAVWDGPPPPRGGADGEAWGGILELNYDLDACDLILALLNDIQRTVWIHAYAGPNGQETYNVGFIQGGAALRP